VKWKREGTKSDKSCRTKGSIIVWIVEHALFDVLSLYSIA